MRLHDSRLFGYEECTEEDWQLFRAPSTSKGGHLYNVLSSKPRVRSRGYSDPIGPTGALASIPRATILNTFQPAHEATDPSRFAGRKKQVLELADALQSEGGVPIIYGERGLGKSSLAVQAQQIAMGSTELLGHLRALGHAIPEESAFLTVFVSCSDGVKNTEDLLQRIIVAIGEVELTDTGGNRFSLVDKSRTTRASLKFFSIEETRKYTAAVDMPLARGTEDRLLNACHLLSTRYDGRVLLIIDELDRVQDKTGLASVIKRLTTSNLKFLLVGIADDWADLMRDHVSLERQAIPIKVPRMTFAELAEIVDFATYALAAENDSVGISAEARKLLVDFAGGFPWFVHVIGQSALVEAYDQGDSTLQKDHVIRGRRDLVVNKYAQHFSDLHRRAVGGSRKRELVLRVIAEHRKSSVPTADVYPVLQEFEITNPSAYVRQLLSDRYGSPLTHPSFHDRKYLSFRNGMFRQYLLLAPPLHDGVDRDAESAMDRFTRR